jgi:hypothetical protein
VLNDPRVIEAYLGSRYADRQKAKADSASASTSSAPALRGGPSEPQP